jgi:hypothetical protein
MGEKFELHAKSWSKKPICKPHALFGKIQHSSNLITPLKTRLVRSGNTDAARTMG